ncbi:MAG: Kelch repeat-containing protein [Myxococcales bacterium]
MKRFPTRGTALAVACLASACTVQTNGMVYYLCDAGPTYCDANGNPLLAPVDGGRDGGADAGPDAGFDAGPDAGPDAGCVLLAPGAANIDPRWELAAAYVQFQGGSGPIQRLFAIGGHAADGRVTSETQLEELESSPQWLPAAGLLTPRAAFAAVSLAPPGDPLHPGVVVFGGVTATGYLSSMEHFLDHSSGDAPATAWVADAPTLPGTLFGHAAVVEPDGQTVLTCGGERSGSTTAECHTLRLEGALPDGGWIWDPAGWQTAPSMVRQRSQLSMAVGPDGTIYALGGSGSPDPSSEWESLDLDAGAWVLQSAPLVYAHIDAAAVVSGSRLYVVAGETSSSLDGVGSTQVEAFDLDGGSAWTAVHPLNYPRFGLAAVTTPYDGHIHAIGGEHDGCSLGTVEEYDPGNNSWTIVAGQ